VKTVSLRLPDDLHAQLRTLAEDDHRSLNSELIVLLTEAAAARAARTDAP